MRLAYFLPLALMLSGSQAFAFGAYSAYLRCRSANSYSSIPFSDAEAEGFGFDEGAQILLDNEILDASVVSFNNQNDFAKGPSLFTIKSQTDRRKLGYTIQARENGVRKAMTKIEPEDRVDVEIFNRRGVSLGTENAVCEIQDKH